jgi:protein MpaA
MSHRPGYLKLAVLFCCALTLSGCVAAVGGRSSEAGRAEPIVMLTSEHRPLVHVAYGEGAETVLVVGGMHGDEPAGAELAWGLIEYLDAHPEVCAVRRVVVAPALNPDGLARGRRVNAAGVDLNRSFPVGAAQRKGADSDVLQRETEFLVTLFERYRPVRVIQLHQPLACVDWDGPAEALARRMAKAAGLPAKKLGARPGSLGSYAGVERKIPTANLELPESASDLTRNELWGRYGDAMRIAIGESDQMRLAPDAR